MTDYASVMNTLIELGVFESKRARIERQMVRSKNFREAYRRNGCSEMLACITAAGFAGSFAPCNFGCQTWNRCPHQL